MNFVVDPVHTIHISPVANLQPRLVLLVRVVVVALPRSRIAATFMQAVSLAPAIGIEDIAIILEANQRGANRRFIHGDGAGGISPPPRG